MNIDTNTLPKNRIQLYGYDNYFNEFLKMYQSEILPNKILLSGLSGIGKATFIYHFVNYILSINEEYKYDVNSFSINKDNRSFNLINENIHPNFHLIELGENKQNIEISQIRNMINYVHKTTFDKSFKFVLIDNVEYLNINSVNALLKITEDFHNKTIFFLNHNSSKKIIDTLKSRFVKFNISFTNTENILNLNKILLTDGDKINQALIEELFSYYDTPGQIIYLINFAKEMSINLENFSLDDLIITMFELNKKNINNQNFNLLNNLIELGLYKKFQTTKNKGKIYSIYSSFIKQVNDKKIYNLDTNNLYYEIKNKYFDAK